MSINVRAGLALSLLPSARVPLIMHRGAEVANRVGMESGDGQVVDGGAFVTAADIADADGSAAVQVKQVADADVAGFDPR